MSTYETYVDHRPIVASGGSNAAGFPQITVFQNEFDAARRNLEAGDVAEVLRIPKNAHVYGVFVEVLQGEADAVISVGDGDDDDRYHSEQSAATTGTAVSSTTDRFYADYDTIDVKMHSGSAEVMRVRVSAMVAAYG